MIRFIAIAAALAFAPLAEAQTPSLLAVRAIQEAQKAPGFDRTTLQLDVFRAQIAAGVRLNAAAQADMAELAVASKLPVEAETLMKPLVDAGTLDPTRRERLQKMYAAVQQDAEDTRSYKLMANENTAGWQDTGDLYIATGDNYLGLADYAKAEDLIQKGLTRGRLTPQSEALARLHLGIAQQRRGKPEAARATWAAIKSDTGAEQLAKAWTILSLEGR